MYADAERSDLSVGTDTVRGMTTGALALTAITVVLLLLGAWIGICIDNNRRAVNRERAHLRISQQFVDELNVIGSRYGLAGPEAADAAFANTLGPIP